jgi:hypothetical protein
VPYRTNESAQYQPTKLSIGLLHVVVNGG